MLGFREKASWARSASLWGIEEKDMDELSAEIVRLRKEGEDVDVLEAILEVM